MVEESIILQICEAIAEKIYECEEYEDISWFYHQGEITPSNHFPALLIEPQDVKSSSSEECYIDVSRELRISLFLREEKPRDTIRKTYLFVEKIRKLFSDRFENSEVHENVDKFSYSRNTAVRTCYLETISTGNTEFVADVVDLYFDLDYHL